MGYDPMARTLCRNRRPSPFDLTAEMIGRWADREVRVTGGRRGVHVSMTFTVLTSRRMRQFVDGGGEPVITGFRRRGGAVVADADVRLVEKSARR